MSGKVEISGKVESAEKTLLADAEVTLLNVENHYREGLRLHDPDQQTELIVAQVLSKVDGSFQITAPEPGLYTLRVEAPGRLPWEYPLALVEPLELPTIQLRKAMAFDLTVQDGDGKPVSKAWARVSQTSRWRQQKPGSGDWLPSAQLTRGGTEGRLRLRRDAIRSSTFEVWAPGFLEATVRTGQQTQRTLELQRGIWRDLDIRHDDGSPAANVLVRVGQGEWSAGWTDAEGRFRVAAPREAPLRLVLITPEGRATVVHLLPISSQSSTKASVFYLEKTDLSGRVLSAKTGEPLQNAVVWTARDRGVFTRSDRRGHFVLPMSGQTEGQRLRSEAAAHLHQHLDLTELHDSERPEIALRPAMRWMGRVVDTAGRGIANAEIQAHGDLSRNPFLESPLAISARTDETGGFVVAALPEAPAHELIVHASGFASMSFILTQEQTGETIELVLKRGRHASGQVTDLDGRAVSGAGVLLYPSTEAPDRRLIANDLHPFRSDDEGNFHFSNILPGRYDLGVSVSGFASTLVRGIEIPDDGTDEPGDQADLFDLGTVILAPEASLVGRVTDPDGRPVVGATLSFLALVYDVGPRRDQLSTRQVARTDGAGNFRLRSLEAGQRVDLKIEHQDFQTREIFKLEAPLEEPIDIVLEPAFQLAGQVVDASNQPVPEAEVVLQPVGGSEHEGALFSDIAGRRSNRTDRAGDFLFASLEPGTYRLWAVAPGFLRSAELELEVTSGLPLAPVLRLSPGASLTGRVLDPDERPVRNARVSILATSRPGPDSKLEAVSQADGSFAIKGLVPGRTVLEVHHADYPRKVSEVEIEVALNRIDLTLDRGRELVGWVVDEGGAPVASAKLSLKGGGQGRKNAISQSDGSFRFAGLTAGQYLLRTQKDGYAESEKRVSFSIGEPIEVRLQAGGSIRGQILGLDPIDFARVQVSASRMGQAESRGEVDFDGAYRIEDLAAGDWRVEATLAGHRARAVTQQVQIDPAAPETFLDLDFASGIELTGEVRQDGLPMPGVRVDLIRENFTGHRGGESDMNGRFVLSGLEAGNYELAVTALKSGRSHRQQISLDSDREIVVELESGEIRGRVLSAADGRPLAGALLEFAPASSFTHGPRPRARSDANGHFAVDGLQADAWRVEVHRPGYARRSELVDLSSGTTRDDVEIALEPGNPLDLRVLTSAGQGAKQVEIVLLDAEARTVISGTYLGGVDGAIQIPDLPSGEFKVQLAVPGEGTIEVPVTVPGPPQQVRFANPNLAGSSP